MSIKMIRIDDRLIHGQIVTAWAKNLGIETIWVVDDATAEDDFLKGVMTMVAPSDKKLVITKESEVPDLIDKYDNQEGNVLVLVKVPRTAKLFFDNGVKIKELNIGGMGASPERSKLFKNISASEDEKKTLQEIKDKGIDVYFQVTPDEKRTSFEI